MATSSSGARHDIVIVGGGIIGATSAYFMSRHPAYSPQTHRIIMLEASTVAGGASGKAGGLLALWAYPSNIVPLSFKLHAQLAEEHDGANRWGYRTLHCGQVDCVAKTFRTTSSNNEGRSVSMEKRNASALNRLAKAGFPPGLNWLDADCARGFETMGSTDDTAQVHPFQFTCSMAELAREQGVEIIEGAHVNSINTVHDSVSGVTYTTKAGDSCTISAKHVVLAAGPWTQNLFKFAPISGLRAHSVVIKASVSPYALFTSISDSEGKYGHSAPEIYARPFGEVYACGEGDTLVPLPKSTEEVSVDQQRCVDILEQVAGISEPLRHGEVVARQACYLPVCSGSGGPYIGETRQVKGLILASGHSCWGIQNGPATGKLVSEIVMDGKAISAKLGALDPARVL